MQVSGKARKLTEQQRLNAARIEALQSAASYLEDEYMPSDPVKTRAAREIAAGLNSLANRIPHRLPRFMKGAN